MSGKRISVARFRPKLISVSNEETPKIQKSNRGISPIPGRPKPEVTQKMSEGSRVPKGSKDVRASKPESTPSKQSVNGPKNRTKLTATSKPETYILQQGATVEAVERKTHTVIAILKDRNGEEITTKLFKNRATLEERGLKEMAKKLPEELEEEEALPSTQLDDADDGYINVDADNIKICEEVTSKIEEFQKDSPEAKGIAAELDTIFSAFGNLQQLSKDRQNLTIGNRDMDRNFSSVDASGKELQNALSKLTEKNIQNPALKNFLQEVSQKWNQSLKSIEDQLQDGLEGQLPLLKKRDQQYIKELQQSHVKIDASKIGNGGVEATPEEISSKKYKNIDHTIDNCKEIDDVYNCADVLCQRAEALEMNNDPFADVFFDMQTVRDYFTISATKMGIGKRLSSLKHDIEEAIKKLNNPKSKIENKEQRLEFLEKLSSRMEKLINQGERIGQESIEELESPAPETTTKTARSDKTSKSNKTAEAKKAPTFEELKQEWGKRDYDEAKYEDFKEEGMFEKHLENRHGARECAYALLQQAHKVAPEKDKTELWTNLKNALANYTQYILDEDFKKDFQDNTSTTRTMANTANDPMKQFVLLGRKIQTGIAKLRKEKPSLATYKGNDPEIKKKQDRLEFLQEFEGRIGQIYDRLGEIAQKYKIQDDDFTPEAPMLSNEKLEKIKNQINGLDDFAFLYEVPNSPYKDSVGELDKDVSSYKNGGILKQGNYADTPGYTYPLFVRANNLIPADENDGKPLWTSIVNNLQTFIGDFTEEKELDDIKESARKQMDLIKEDLQGEISRLEEKSDRSPIEEKRLEFLQNFSDRMNYLIENADTGQKE